MVQITGLNNILICTDGSEFSQGAIREGLSLVKKTGAKVTAVSVLDFNPELQALAPDLIDKMETDIRKHLSEIREKAKEESIELTAFTVLSATPYVEIVKEAQRIGADLIVMGRRGKTGLKKLLIGSVTKRVIGQAPCSVLVVPREAKLLCRNIFCATDGSVYGDAAAAEAVMIAKRCGAELTFISVVHAETASAFDIVHSQMRHDLIAENELRAAESGLKSAREFAHKENVGYESMILAGRPYDVIISSAREKGADLIVMGSHGRTGLDKLLMGSVAERVVGSSECAVLVVKARQ